MTATITESPLRIALIAASQRSPRMAGPLLTWLRLELEDLDWLQLDPIDLATVDLPPAQLVPGGVDSSPISGRLATADAFVILTPEYNHSFPSGLKNAIDWHFAEWAYKPVAFVGYGGGSGGIRAVEQLRLVFPELRATTVREAVHLVSPWERLTEGRFDPDDGIRGALASTLEELRWWALALRDGRARDRDLVAL